MRALESVVVGLALALVVAGIALVLVTAPWFTRALVVRLDVPTTASLPAETALRIAEEVRSFSTRWSGGSLPAEVDGRPGFDEAAVSHLEDVRAVFVAAKEFALVVAIAVAVWLGISIGRRRFDRIAAALRAGAVWCLALPIVAAIAGSVDFESFFSAFHGIFFESGTWTFPADALLIQLFPERFWMTAGGALAAFVVLGGVVLWLASAGVRRIERRDASRAIAAGA